jgi:hypothetical protein
MWGTFESAGRDAWVSRGRFDPADDELHVRHIGKLEDDKDLEADDVDFDDDDDEDADDDEDDADLADDDLDDDEFDDDELDDLDDLVDLDDEYDVEETERQRPGHPRYEE